MGIGFWAGFAQGSFGIDAQVAVRNFHFNQDAYYVDACTACQGSQHQALGAYTGICSAMLGGGIHYNFVISNGCTGSHAGSIGCANNMFVHAVYLLQRSVNRGKSFFFIDLCKIIPNISLILRINTYLRRPKF